MSNHRTLIGTCEQKVYQKGFPRFILGDLTELRNKRVLDVGCGAGNLGEVLQKQGNDCYGITLSQREAELARSKLTQVIVTDLDATSELPFAKDFFDVVICTDVLEHLKNPKHALELIRPYLRSDGFLITSIPNIANVEIRLKLLCGRFDYAEFGILDNTHLRFFTMETAKELLTSAGYAVRRITFTNWSYTLPKLLAPFYEWEIKQRLTRWWPGLFATQFVFHASALPGIKPCAE